VPCVGAVYCSVGDLCAKARKHGTRGKGGREAGREGGRQGREGGIGSCSDKDLMISFAPVLVMVTAQSTTPVWAIFGSHDLSVPSAQCSLPRFYLPQQRIHSNSKFNTWTIGIQSSRPAPLFWRDKIRPCWAIRYEKGAAGMVADWLIG